MAVVEAPDPLPQARERFIRAEPVDVPEPDGEVGLMGPLFLRDGAGAEPRGERVEVCQPIQPLT